MSKSVIYKYPIGGPCPVIPLRAKVLHIGLQHTNPFVWCEVPTDLGTNEELSKVIAVPTGQEVVTEGLTFLGTILFLDGNLVMHFYRTN